MPVDQHLAAPPRWSPRSGAKPPSSPTAVPRPRSCSVRLRLWKTSAPMRRHSANVARPDRHDHELLEVDLVVGVHAAVEHVHHRHRAARAPPRRRGSATAAGAPPRPPRAPRPARRRGSRWRRGATCSACRRASISARSSAAWSSASRPATAVGDLAVDVGHRLRDALAHPGRRRRRAARSPRTRRSTRPTGTAARPQRPSAAHSSTSTVGLPRQSRIWRAWTCSIWLMSSPPSWSRVKRSRRAAVGRARQRRAPRAGRSPSSRAPEAIGRGRRASSGRPAACARR